MDGFFDWLRASGEELREKTADTIPQEVDLIQSFKTKAQEWAILVNELRDTVVTDPALITKKQSLLKWAETIRKGVESITGTIDGLGGAGLGITPLVPIAVVAASLAAMTKWTYDYKKFKEAASMQKELIASGTSPKTANEMVTKLFGKGPLVSFKSPKLIGAILIAGGGYLFAKNQGWIK